MIKKIYLCMGLLAISSSVYAVDDNYFCMDNAAILNSTLSHSAAMTSNSANITFNMDSSNSYSISSNETFDGVNNVTSGSNNGCIDVEADRNNTSTPVNWVKSEEDNDNSWWNSSYMTYSTGGGSPPSDLNFAVEGTLNITLNGTTYSCPHTIIAQGHEALTNNWLIFDNEQAYENGWHNALYCNDNSGNSYEITLEGDGSYDIKVSKVIEQ